MAQPGGREQLRIAVAMNGGVSLAAWMGGMTLELARLARGEGVYGELLDDLGIEPLVDVVSGTSAGGLNGAFLATALVHGTDLMPLRDLWVERASFGALLRDPLTEPDPASLLRGDAYFRPELEKVFTVLARGPRRDPEDAPMDLTLTATQLAGRPVSLADDFGTVIADVDHRSRFTFRRGGSSSGDAFAHPRLVQQLALAARSSASFPGAFEASWIPWEDDDAARELGMPTLAAGTMDRAAYVVDGGVLDNKPVEAAIDGIRRQRAGQRFRRVLLYVVPNPGETHAAAAAGPPPSLGSVVWSSLVTIPRNESVVGALRDARDDNRRTEEAIEARLALGRTLDAGSLARLGETLFDTYVEVRTDRSARYLVDEIARGYAAEKGVGLPYRGRREQLRSRFTAGRLPWIPNIAPTAAWRFLPGAWSWGMRPAEEGLLLLTNALRWAAEQPHAGAAPDLRPEWRRYHSLREAAQGDRPVWQEIGHRLAADGTVDVTAELRGWARGQLPVPALGLDTAQLGLAPPEEASRTSHAGWLAIETAATIAAVAAKTRPAPGAAGTPMGRLLELLAPDGASDVEVLRRLLQFHVVTSSLGRGPEVHGQVVEVMQVSAGVPDPFQPDRPVDVASKLAGVQLGHFGAFYKRSWRAHDWMRGRLDGALRLVQLVMSPAALRRAFPAGPAAPPSARAEEWLRGLGQGGAGEPLAAEWELCLPELRAELAFLDDPEAVEPDGLPHAVGAVARRLHVEIGSTELPVVARAAERDAAEGSRAGSPSDEFLEAYRQLTGSGAPIRQTPLPADHALRLLPLCRLGEERVFAHDAGTDRFAATVATTLGVGVGAVHARGIASWPLRLVLGIARAPILILYLLVRQSTTEGALGPVVTSVALTFGLTIVLLSLFTDGVRSLAAIGWAVLIASMLALWIRGRKLLVAIGLAAAAVGGGIVAARDGWSEAAAAALPFLTVAAFFLVIGSLPWLAAKFPPRRRPTGKRLDPELAARLQAAAQDYYAEREPLLAAEELGELRSQRDRVVKQFGSRRR